LLLSYEERFEKHFEFDIHFICDHVEYKQVHLLRLLGKFQVVDIIMKLWSGSSFKIFKGKLMIILNFIINSQRDNNVSNTVTNDTCVKLDK